MLLIPEAPTGAVEVGSLMTTKILLDAMVEGVRYVLYGLVILESFHLQVQLWLLTIQKVGWFGLRVDRMKPPLILRIPLEALHQHFNHIHSRLPVLFRVL